MLTLDQKLYQLIICRLNGDQISSKPYQEELFKLVQNGIGGFIIFGGNKEDLRLFVSKLQAAARIPLFIASDIERGVGQQAEGASNLPSQMAIAAALDRDNIEDMELLEDALHSVGDEAMDVGINMPLIPVLDVNKNPDNPIICTRAFSDNPADVAMYGSMYIKVLEDKGLLSCAKHFPGHGDTDIDSHISLPVITKPLNDLMETDAFPFKEAIKAGVSSIMIGHLSIPAVDTLPASLSYKLVTGILRRELGYEGLVLTDALNMHALQEIEDVATKCIDAGVDIILHPADTDHVVKELEAALVSGILSEDKIDIAVGRILEYKSKIKNTQSPRPDYNKHAALVEIISDRAVTLVKGAPGILPGIDLQKTLLKYSWDENKHDLSVLLDYFHESGNISGNQNGAVRETVIFALFTSIAAWKGSSGIMKEEIDTIKKCIKSSQKAIVISFGSPYVLRHFKEADMLIAAYDSSGQAQTSVIKCLKGERKFEGSLPVDLSFC